MEKRRHSELRTQRKRYSMERLIFSVLLLSAVQHSVLADTRRSTATGSRNRLRQKLEEMCTLSYDTLYGRMTNNPRIFHGWVEELGPLTKTQRRDRYFYDRPVDTPPNSICQPMNTTCCSRRTEKHIVQLAQKEYGELLLNVTYEHVGGCLTVGRRFYHAMYSNFIEIRRQLEIPINHQLDGKLPSDLFDDFFSYLSSFSVTSDLCDLSLELEAIMLKLFTFVYDAQYGENLSRVHAYAECYENVSMHIMTSHYNRLFVALERQMYNLDLIFRAMHSSETIVQRLKKHRFSSVCTKPLTQLQNCGHCTGYAGFKPCLFYCLNVFKGCFADVADVAREFQLLTKALSDIPDDILGTFQPERFIGDSLAYFIQLTEDLTSRDLKREIADACSHHESIRRKRSPDQPSSNLATVTPTVTQDDRLLATFNIELRCMEDIASLLKSVPEQMCYQSKQYDTVADTGNDRCWIGSRMGTYYHSEVSSKKEDQVDNPEFRGGPPPYLDQYVDLCMDISTIAAEVNETLDLILCLDDEDCSTAPFYICEEDDLELYSSGGSGYNTSMSGSGSGSGRSMDDGLRDMEDGDEPIMEDHEATESTPVSTPIPLPNITTEDTIEGEGYTVIDIKKTGSGDNATVDSSGSGDNATANTTVNPSVTSGTPDVEVQAPEGEGDQEFTVVGSSTRITASGLSLLTVATVVLQFCTGLAL